MYFAADTQMLPRLQNKAANISLGETYYWDLGLVTMPDIVI